MLILTRNSRSRGALITHLRERTLMWDSPTPDINKGKTMSTWSLKEVAWSAHWILSAPQPDTMPTLTTQRGWCPVLPITQRPMGKVSAITIWGQVLKARTLLLTQQLPLRSTRVSTERRWWRLKASLYRNNPSSYLITFTELCRNALKEGKEAYLDSVNYLKPSTSTTMEHLNSKSSTNQWETSRWTSKTKISSLFSIPSMKIRTVWFQSQNSWMLFSANLINKDNKLLTRPSRSTRYAGSHHIEH